MPTTAPRPPWLLALPVVLLVAALAGWLLLADEPAPPPVLGPSAATERAAPDAPPAGVTPPTVTLQGTSGDGGPRATPGQDGRRDDPGATPSTAADAVVTGRVIDPDGRPIPGAQVVAGGLRGEELGPVIALADGAGRFTLDAVPPTGLLEFVAERFARRVLSVEPGSGPLEVVLAPARAIEGQVVAAEDDRPLPGAMVEGESASWRNRARTGPDGRFRFTDAPDEQATLVVTLDGRKGAVVEAADAAQVRLSLGRAIRGLVVDPAGAPVDGAMVFVVGADQLGHPHAARTDDGGRFEVTGIGDDEAFAVLAFAFVGGEELGTPLELSWIEAGEGEEVTTTLLPARTVEVRGAPDDVLAALVPVSCPPGVPAGSPRAGQRAGATLRFEGLLPGAWQLEANGRVVGPIVDVPAGDPRQPVTIDWPADAARPPAGPPVARVGPLRVRVVDETGRPVQGATVVVSGSGEGGGQLSRQTGPDGLVEVAEPPPGVLVLSASVPGRVLVAPVTLDDASPPGDVQLTLARPVTLEGRVRMPAAGGAAYVTLHAPDGAVLRASQVQPDGRFKLTDLPPGPVIIEVVGDGCRPVELQVELPLTGELVVPLEPMGELHEHHEGDGHDHHEGGKG